MNNIYLTVFFCALAFVASAGQLEGLDGLGTVLICILIGGLSFVAMIFSAIARFSKRGNKPNIVLTVSGIALILSCLIAINTLGSGIDPGFLATCLGLTVLSLLLIFLNLRRWNNSN